MKNSVKKPSLSRFALYKAFLGLSLLEGLLAIWFLFRVPSESQSAFLANFSLQRLGLGFASLLMLVVLLLLLIDSFTIHKIQSFLAEKLDFLLDQDVFHILIRSTLTVIMISSLATILFFQFPDLQRFIFFLPNNYIFGVLGERAGFLIGWVFLISLQLLMLYYLSGRVALRKLDIPTRLMLICGVLEGFLLLLLITWSLISHKLSPQGFLGPGSKLLVLTTWFAIWSVLNRRREWAKRFYQAFVCISIGLVVFTISLQFAQWFNVWGPRPDDQFILLAASFLRGKIYFIDVPHYLHDLTFYNGHWFIACPPFPILLITPLVAIWGVQAFNINTVSLLLLAFSSVIIYRIFSRLNELGWTRISHSATIWLTSLFAFGTMNWWLSILGTAGFFAQVVTVFFCGLAFLTALKRVSPWITGFCLMAAVMSRPNVFVLWPALVAIMIQRTLIDDKLDWKTIIGWCLQSAIPVFLGAGLLLYYNYARFGNFLDFGYATINGSAQIVKNVQDYGLFNLHFVPVNLRSMFINWPDLRARCGYFFNNNDGLSILMTTPAVIFVLRKFKFSWWMAGCWLSILLSIILLSLYSNNGSNQYGYRYLMDFIFPILMLIAANINGNISKFLKTLIIASIFINYYGTISWFLFPC